MTINGLRIKDYRRAQPEIQVQHCIGPTNPTFGKRERLVMSWIRCTKIERGMPNLGLRRDIMTVRNRAGAVLHNLALARRLYARGRLPKTALYRPHRKDEVVRALWPG